MTGHGSVNDKTLAKQNKIFQTDCSKRQENTKWNTLMELVHER
jgi:hypothetical protein